MTKLYEPAAAEDISRMYVEARAALSAPAVEPNIMQGFPPGPHARVTRANWTAPPFSQWGFRNVSKLLPTTTVFAGEVEPSLLPERLVDLDNFKFYSVTSERVTLAEHLQATRTNAFLVMRKNEVIYERYFNGQSPVDRHITFSLGQALVGTIAEELLYRGVLTEKACVRDYVHDLRDSAFADATIRDLMDMSVGIDYREDYEDPLSDCVPYGYASGLVSVPPGVESNESLYSYLMSLRKLGRHGESFHYVTANSEVLAWAMECATGSSFSELVQQLWRKLRCERDAFFISDGWGRAVAGAGFNATLRDIARFGAMIAQRGRYQGRQLLPQSIISTIAEGGSPEVYAKQVDYSRWTPGASYKSQWYVFNHPGSALMASGIHGQYLYIDLVTETVVVKLSSQSDAVGKLDPDSIRLLRAIGSY